MRIHVYDNDRLMSLAAAQIVAQTLRTKKTAKLGLPTGNTPLGLYAELVRLHRQEGLSFSQALTFNLDEYVGLAPEAPQSYHSYMRENLFSHVDMPPQSIFIPDGFATDPQRAAAEYAHLLEQHAPLDLLILGIGSNGHIGFNEPGSPWDSRTRVLDLTPETRQANARYFGGDLDRVPLQAITMGIAEISTARQILLLASGGDKAEIIHAALHGPQTENIPASALQGHPDLLVLLDREAGRLM